MRISEPRHGTLFDLFDRPTEQDTPAACLRATGDYTGDRDIQGTREEGDVGDEKGDDDEST